jgi:pimeloyl-ACP methyl ester carboxylesterase
MQVSAQAATMESTAVRHYNDFGNTRMTEGFVEVGAARLHYVTAGKGPLVIMYHGFPSFWYAWKHQIQALSAHYQVVALDGLGTNLSDRPDNADAYDIARLASDLDAVARHFSGDDPFILIGHDWGGALSWAFAQRYPARVSKLVVLSAPPYNLFLDLLQNNPDQQRASTYMERLKSSLGEKVLSAADAYLMWQLAYGKLVDQGYLTEAEGELFREALARPGALKGGINWYRANAPSPQKVTEDDFWPSRYAKVSNPSLLIWGQQDKTFVPEFIERLGDYVPDLNIEVIPQAGHWPALSHPQVVNRRILGFLCGTEC